MDTGDLILAKGELIVIIRNVPEAFQLHYEASVREWWTVAEDSIVGR